MKKRYRLINIGKGILNVSKNNLEQIYSDPSKTSELINNGEDGINPFITINDVPENLPRIISGQLNGEGGPGSPEFIEFTRDDGSFIDVDLFGLTSIIPQNTSQLFNDGSNESNTYITSDEVATGWADHADTQYTAVSPFSVLANTDTLLPNNNGTIQSGYKPADVTTFYDGTVITGRTGDGLAITIDFKAVPTNVNTTYLEVWIDITGGTGSPANLAKLYPTPITFPKGAGEVRPVSFTVIGYTLGTWEANGGVVKIRSNGAMDIYDIRYVLTRTHKGQPLF